MNVISKIIVTSLAALISFNELTPKAIGKPNSKLECPNAFPDDYKSPEKTKSVKIPELGITVQVPTDRRLVYIKRQQRFTFMTPPEYKSYQCSVAKNIKDYKLFYPSIYYELSYTVIKNPKREPILKRLKEVDKYSYLDARTQLRLNNIDFVTTAADRSDPVMAWFIPKMKPDLIVVYRFMNHDLARKYDDFKSDLSKIENISD